MVVGAATVVLGVLVVLGAMVGALVVFGVLGEMTNLTRSQLDQDVFLTGFKLPRSDVDQGIWTGINLDHLNSSKLRLTKIKLDRCKVDQVFEDR